MVRKGENGLFSLRFIMEENRMREFLTRTRMLMGEAALDALEGARVAVFGVGGVGGYVVEVLARSGVGELVLFDNDTVCESNINRQIIATRSSLGRPKVEVAAERVASINPECIVEARQMFYTPDNADKVDLAAFDYVVDCIDTVSAKLELIRRCHSLGVPIICSMGAANKMDASAFRVVDLFKTNIDPLAKVLRKQLRKTSDVRHVKVVCSEEVPMDPLPDEPATEQLATKKRIPASNAFVPAAAGLILGGEVVRDLTSSVFRLSHEESLTNENAQMAREKAALHREKLKAKG